MKPVIAQLILNPEEDHDTTGQPHGKPQNVDKGIPLVSFDVS